MMDNLYSYLLQMSCWLGAFWLVYTLVLKKETYFKLNRWFLVVGLFLSMVMPLFPVSYKVYRTIQPMVSEAIPTNFAAPMLINVPQGTESNSSNYLFILYLSGLLAFLIRFVIQNIKLYNIRKNSPFSKHESLKVFQIAKDVVPFSFLNHIYVSSKLSNQAELSTIIAHEKVHITERHWADLLLLEVVRTIQWFNPLLKLYRKAMMQNHEYLADSGTLANGVNLRTYHAVLANQMLGVPVVSFASGFTFRNSTNRLLMMKKNKSNSKNLLKFLAVLPFMAIIIVGFAKPNYVYENNTSEIIAKDPITVKGKVVDQNGKGIHGANVVAVEKSTNHFMNGTVTNMDGDFKMMADPDNMLKISLIGYETVNMEIKNELKVVLKEQAVKLTVGKLDNPNSGKMTGVRQEEVKPPPPPPAPKQNEKKEIETASSNETEVFIIVEDMPKFPGGEDALKQYFDKKIRESNGKGEATVSFVIDTKGAISNVKVLESSSKSLEPKAIKMIEDMPTWTPGKQRGKPVKMSYIMTIQF